MDTQYIHDFTLTARSLLIKEAAELLDGVFGVDSDGRFAPAAKLYVLEELPEAEETHRRLKKYCEDEKEAGLFPTEAVAKLFKEVAFTHLNRLVALKMLEARKLVRGTIDRHHESNAFKFYLVENPKEEVEYKRGLMPQNGIGEGPRDAAYRRFLLEQYRRLSQEIRVLFDPDNLASRLFPRPKVLKQVIDALNSEKLAEAWQPGSEETIGWVYQFFNEQEKKDAFRRVSQEKKKFRREDIPAATQIFTPRWIVKFLVQNSLGRLWVSMHPDSAVIEKLDYLVPLAGECPKPVLKLVRDIRLLDPATGTMHFGMVAFDLLLEMYREEIVHAGQDGWPEIPSVSTEAEIASAIVANNLFGIDIDLRAVQLSALALYVKAKHANKTAVFRESNLACADVLPLYGKHLDEFILSTKFPDPVYERVIRALWQRLEPASYIGSLVRVDEALREIVEEERKKFRRKPDGKMVLPGFETILKSEDEFWAVLEAQIIQTLDEFARHQATKGLDESYFAGEAKKGMRVVDLLTRHYDVIFTNPPYMSNRNMSAPMSTFLKREYKKSKGDLYAAFIERCSNLLAPGGRVAMIAQQSFMFISSYKDMRIGLADSTAIETMAHTGPRAFEEVSGEKVNTAAFVLRHEEDSSTRKRSLGTYFRLVKEPGVEAKRVAFEQALKRRRQGEADSRIYDYSQGDFTAIPGAPWVYWITPGLRSLFSNTKALKDFAEPRQGLATTDNPRFLRFWWEVGGDQIARDCKTAKEAEESQAVWFPYMKGGGTQRWYGNQREVINYFCDGKELKAWVQQHTGESWSKRVASADVYFKPGISWSKVSSGRFAARLNPGGYLFDVGGCCAFPEEIKVASLLGHLNSVCQCGLLTFLSPTLNFEVGQIASLPLIPKSNVQVEQLAESAVALGITACQEDETSHHFVAPLDLRNGEAVLAQRRVELVDIERQNDEEVLDIYNVSSQDRTVLRSELSLMAEVAAEDDGENGEEESEEETDGDASPSILPERWIAYAVGVALGRFQPGVDGAIGRGQFSAPTSEELLALQDPDGLMVLDPGHSDDLAARVIAVLEVAAGDSEALEIVRTATGDQTANADSLRVWLSRAFFRDHIKLYRKRPVYWLLESPKKKYGLYLFHERATKDTLPLIRGPKYLGGRINRAKDEIAQLSGRERSAAGANKTKYRRQREEVEELLEDLEAFDKNLAAAMSVEIEDAKSRKITVGWAPEIGDGVLINMAPTWFLFPSWKDEPKKCWEKLKKGDYDWSHTAMRYWPKRVLEACKKNKSYAIAHGV